MSGSEAACQKHDQMAANKNAAISAENAVKFMRANVMPGTTKGTLDTMSVMDKRYMLCKNTISQTQILVEPFRRVKNSRRTIMEYDEHRIGWLLKRNAPQLAL